MGQIWMQQLHFERNVFQILTFSTPKPQRPHIKKTAKFACFNTMQRTCCVTNPPPYFAIDPSYQDRCPRSLVNKFDEKHIVYKVTYKKGSMN